MSFLAVPCMEFAGYENSPSIRRDLSRMNLSKADGIPKGPKTSRLFFQEACFLYDAYLVCQAQEVDPIPFVMSSFFK